jgi:hypothetical protein
MLRAAVIGIGALTVAGGVLLVMCHIAVGGIMTVLWGILLLAGTIFEQRRYKKVETATTGAGWQATDEKFMENGAIVTVWYNKTTGERRYINGG